MAEIEKQQKRWYAKSTFNSLDKTTIPVGTEIQVTGPIEEADLNSTIVTKLNSISNKLDKPTGEITEDSVPVISSTGTVSAKPLSELKIYLHRIQMTTTWNNFGNTVYVYLERYESNSTQYTLDTFIAKLKNKGIFSCSGGATGLEYSGISFLDAGSNIEFHLYEVPSSAIGGRSDTIGSGVTIDSFSDNVMEM